MIDFGEVLKGVFGGKKAETQTPIAPVQPQQPTAEQQIATHQATIQASENTLKQIGMDPIPQDKPIIEAEQAKIAQAREAISNLTPQPPTVEPTPPGISQIPVAPQAPEQPVGEPKVIQPTELPKAA